MPANQTQTNNEILPLPLDFFRWYYSIAIRNIFSIWGGYLTATLHYFSISLLLRTLFGYWHKDIEAYGRGFDPARYARVLVMNMISRGVGFVIRASTIIFGLATELLLVVTGVLFLLVWLAAPVLIVAAVIKGFSLVI